MPLSLSVKTTFPADGTAGALVSRVWVPGDKPAPVVAALRDDGVYALGREAPTSADLMEAADPPALVKNARGARLGGIEEILANSALGPRYPKMPHFLAPIDLQAFNAAGVTFMRSLL
jgi:fumarylacetoacetate (FAA) hydrolase family protein